MVGDQSLKALASDALYPAAYSLVTVPLIYLVSGETDPKKIIYPTIVAAGTNVVKHVGGYWLQDRFESFKGKINGLKERILGKGNFIGRGEKYKKNVRALAFTVIAATTIFYASLPGNPPEEKKDTTQNRTIIEEILEDYAYGNQVFDSLSFFGK